MIFDLNIRNKYVDFQHVRLDFSRYGVYILSGPNGVGKSTIMKQLAFGDNVCDFNTPDQKKAYEDSRQELVTYVEQDPIPDGTSIKNFLYKGKASIDTDLLDELIKIFSLDRINLNHSVSTLSGGEFCKFNIIAGLLKKTPYVFMDEPTNNFDNEAVRELIQVIKSLFTERTFIIVSHDPRFTIDGAVTIEVAPGKATAITKSVAPLNVLSKSANSIPKFRLLIQHLMRPSIIISGFFYLTAFIFAILINYILYNSLHSFDSLPKIQDCIATYKVDQVYAQLNETYAHAENINIDDSAKNSMILFSDISNIASMPFVERIIFSDESYLYEISDNLMKQADSLNIISVPQDFISNFGDVTSSNIDLRVLYDGNLPKDGANEVALSEKILRNDFGFSDYNHAKGQQIDILGKLYTVVGCTYHDVCIISYESENAFGYIEYNPESYDNKVNAISKYLSDIDATLNNGPFNVIIYTQDGMEKAVLNQLISDYAAENYISYEYVSTFTKATNFNAAIITSICNMVYILGVSLVIILIFRKSSILFKNELHTLEVYYINKKTPRNIFITARFVQVLIVAIISTVVAKLLVKDFLNIYMWLTIDYVALSIPVFVFYNKHGNKKKRKQQRLYV